jgi:copper transport protein
MIGFLWLALVGGAGYASAHASLVKTTPSANEKLATGPAYVDVTFNERLDEGANELAVLNASSRVVADGKPESIDGGKGLRLTLPKLGEGYYTVSYKVISADGHPVSGAFVFIVGNPAAPPNASQLDPHAQVGHTHDHGGGGLTVQKFLFYSARVLYFAGLLALAGLALWSLSRNTSVPVRETRERAIGLVGQFALLATLAYVFFSLQDLSQGEPLSDWLRVLTDTTIGRLYIAELLLALAAPFLRSFGLPFRLGWAVIALFLEAWSGHAASFEPFALTVGLDFVHLIAASLWTGGLLLVLALWAKDRPEAGRFALRFSKWALISFLALWVTGISSTLIFLPSLSYLLVTSWGLWLISKAGLTVIVAATAFLIRLRLRKGDLPRGALLKTDVGLLAAIVLVVGIFTYQSPLPANEPLHYHQMGEDMHVTLRITPNAPGDNEVLLKIWLKQSIGNGISKKTELLLIPQNRKETGAIVVPLEPYADEELDGFPGFEKTAYRAKGPFMPFPGEWKAQIRVTDAADNERVEETTFRIY